MYSHHAKGIDVASTLGAVGLDSLKKFGRLPESSTNLSKYSLPVVTKVNKMLGRKDTHEEDLNNLDRSNGKNGLEMAHNKFDNVENDPRHVRENALSRGITYSKMSKEDVAQGSNLVRSMFKRPKLSKQFDQLELPL